MIFSLRTAEYFYDRSDSLREVAYLNHSRYLRHLSERYRKAASYLVARITRLKKKSSFFD